MAWTSPRTFVALELLTASIFNTHARDNLNALRDYMLGAQDLGSNWLISSGRKLQLSDPDVAHGMTGLAPTAVYGSLEPISGTVGGLFVIGYSDANQAGLHLWGVNGGTSSPTAAPVIIRGSKKSGTSTTAVASTDVLVNFSNDGSIVATLFAGGDLYLNAGSLFAPNGVDLGVGVLSILEPGCILFPEASADPDTALMIADTGYLYMIDNGAGKTQLKVRFASGAGIVLATQV